MSAPGENLRINGDRLWQSLMETARIGGTPEGGIARLTLSEDDAKVRAWLAAQTAALGMTLVVDEVGNMFATLPGRNPDLAPIAMGSHLDTQPTGGKFDGVLGVLGALEVVRSITRVKKPNVLGFCVGGTLLTSALAVARARGEDPVASLTLMTTLLDFSDAGELGCLVDEASVTAREAA